MVLSEARRTGSYRVKRLEGSGDHRRHLEDLGFIPGEQILMVSRIAGNSIVNVKGSRVALSAELASHIVV